ncbi:MAG: hypothetical protein ACJ8FK_20350 [Xanthobacteraceae bacterium]|jgi:hypothetical protein
MSSIAQILCIFCISLSGAPYPQLSHGAGGIRYTHEVLGRGTHLLRLSTDYFPFHSDRAALQHMHAFAASFAANTCPGRFLVQYRRSALPPASPLMAENFVFRCR